jgi:elongation factor Ts
MIADVALTAGTDVEKINATKAGSITVAESISDTIAKIGENMTLRRAAGLSVGKGAIGSYVHNAVTDRLGKIGVIVALESPGKPTSSELAARRGMSLARNGSPLGLDPAVVEREKNVLADKFKQQANRLT